MTPTPEQIHAMQAGRETDAAVHEAVFNETVPPEKREWSWVVDLEALHFTPTLPHYSTNIACAFKMQAEIARRNLWEEYVRQLVLLLADAEHAAKGIWYAAESDWWAVANASPLVRCMAALLVMANLPEAARGEG